MSMVVLDTDHMTLLEWASGPEASRLQTRFEGVAPEERATTIVSYEEQSRGWLRSWPRRAPMSNRSMLSRNCAATSACTSGSMYWTSTGRAADEFQRLTESRLRVGPMDLKIAAIVLAHDATLLPKNLRDFRKIEGLKVED
jgi:tRNA(fMet)-specific endonuclease VapC